MPQPDLNAPAAPATSSKAAPSPRRQLPNDLLRAASRRPGITSLLTAALWALGISSQETRTHG